MQEKSTLVVTGKHNLDRPRESTIWDALIFGIAFFMLIVSLICFIVGFRRIVSTIVFILALLILIIIWAIDAGASKIDTYDDDPFE